MEIYIPTAVLYTVLPNIRRAQYNTAFPYKHIIGKTKQNKTPNK